MMKLAGVLAPEARQKASSAVDPFLEFFSHLKEGKLFVLHLDGLTGLGVAPLIASVGFDLETPKAANLNTIFFRKRALDTSKNSFYSYLSLFDGNAFSNSNRGD